MQKDAGKTDLTPPDSDRCQCEILAGSFMTLGPRSYRRCSERPVFIATEVQPGKDGQCGAMSLCPGCTTQMLKDPDLSARVNLTPIVREPA